MLFAGLILLLAWSYSPATLFSRHQAFYPQNTMHKPDRIRALVVALIVFSLYVDLANILTSLALASLPLGTVGSVWVGSTAIVTLTLFDAVILNLYFIRQRKRARTSPSLQ